MTVRDIKDTLDFYSEHGYDDANVLITLSEPSIGARAFAEIKYISAGIDWENGQIRIEPIVELCRKGRTLEDPRPLHTFQYLYDKRTTYSYHCANCGKKNPKDANYCNRCGQRLMPSDEITWTYDYRTMK